uniref:Receptor-like serine/threonine-protein kinase n=1 Tax=Arabidopsis lyrata TaxID=59689 RepID=Q9AVE0_ARALY|nr:unknown [Arabidopsis lyrata]BAB40987.1 SRKb [Arabidopsis lyrata]
MRVVVPNCHHFYIFFVVLILIRSVFSSYVHTLSSTESLTISSKQTIVSPGEVFELGFFNPAATSRDGDRWYLGIWFKTNLERTYVWVANRDNPLYNSTGTLKISDTNLVLLDQFDTLVWSTNLTGVLRSPVVAELLSNGNLVLKDSKTNDKDGILWQSFDYPTDTLLPQMKMGWDVKKGLNRFLRSWKSQYDPSSGDFSYKLETRGFPEFFLLWRNSRVFRSGPWDGLRFSGIPEMQQWEYMVSNFTENREEVAYTFQITNHNIYSRFTMSSTGALKRFRWISSSEEWNQLWNKPNDHCDMYKRCGPYSYCDMNTSPICNCIGGFKPRNLHEWTLRNGSIGCVRKTRLNCGGDGFLCLRKMKLPDSSAAIVDRTIDLGECKKRCLNDCNCTAYASTDIQNGGLGCVIWIEELLDIRNYASGGQDLYVRLADVDIGDERNIRGKIIGLAVGASVILFLSSIMFCVWRRKQKLLRATEAPIVYPTINQGLLMNRLEISSGRHLSEDNQTEDLELPLVEFEAVVMATENFSNSNKLGEGGFGVVYKGRLLDGQEIAVKRLSTTSIQGICEFRNEVKLISKLQHINLVRLFGCCVDENEKMLIYEYLENLSLDSHLFNKSLSCKLNWQMRFDITNGIARGLLYLHQDSRFRIIHRDLKASNVLLDKDMTPKISDFGMARIFGRDETEANTRKVVGTYGYMSPEYAMDGIFSVKSDVFSFGVLVLEIVSGKKNRGFYNSNQDNNLLGYAWRNWKEGKGLEILDPFIVDSSSSPSAFRPHEVLRCIQIGLLCVQERAEDRPVMSSVVVMLRSETETIPQPKPPGYCVGRSPFETDSSTHEQRDESCTVNQITISAIDPR